MPVQLDKQFFVGMAQVCSNFSTEQIHRWTGRVGSHTLPSNFISKKLVSGPSDTP